MADLRRLEPHDPVPEGGRYMLVLRRFGEDDPDVAVTEIITADGRDPPQAEPVLAQGARPMEFEAAVEHAQVLADRQGYGILYVVDRTMGQPERAVRQHHGDRTASMDRFADTDPEDGAQGTDLRDRPRDAGYNLNRERR